MISLLIMLQKKYLKNNNLFLDNKRNVSYYILYIICILDLIFENDFFFQYINICKNNKKDMNKNNIFKLNEYIKSIIEYYTNNISKNKKEIIHLNIIESFNNIDNIILNSNENIYEILGNLLFILLKNKLYYMKDLNNFIDKEKNTQINIAKIVKYSILASGNLAKQYHNDFKFTKLFNNNDIFVDYVTKEIFKK